MRIRGICVALAALLLFSPARAHTRDEVRARYGEISQWSDGAPYQSEPSVSHPYVAGSVRAEALEDALKYLNFLRWLSGLQPVALDSRLTDISQHGAVLQAANDRVSHAPDRPADMDAEFFEKARYAAESSNIARLNWMRDDVLRDAIAHFARDDGEANLPTLGHRRWLLNPRMAATGFGLASAESGNSYVAMYAHDMRADAAAWEYVAWPGAGAFPAELMAPELAWSIVLNPLVHAADGARVVLTDLGTGDTYRFPGDGGFFAVGAGSYGAGPCLIFRPDVADDYRQNQRFRVEVALADGTRIAYDVDMISLYPVAVASVELFPRTLEMSAGERAVLSAGIVPEWADDLSVRWVSGDESVARVENGDVFAVSAGECDVYAVSENGRRDACRVTVR